MNDDLVLEIAALQEVRGALRDRIREGLAEDGREIRALPAYFPPPPDGLAGEAIVVDTGGTNMRAALVRLQQGRTFAVTKGPVQRRLDVRDAGKSIDRDRFFAMQAELVAELSPPADLPVGYCFSYPSEVLPNRDARLIKWTKGIDIPGVEGSLVGRGLHEALDSVGVKPTLVRVLNDTVASLLGGAFAIAGGDPAKTIGLIVGTGTNMAAFFSPGGAPKLARLGATAHMSVNLESGNFTPPHLSAADDAVDARSDNPGLQRFEKAVSGFYLPYVFAERMPDMTGFSPEAGSAKLVELRDGDAPNEASELAGRILGRSADLVAAGLAAVMDCSDGDDAVGILAEGSLYWGDPKFADRVQDSLTRLLEGRRRFAVQRMENANLVGSACAALVP